MWNRWPSIGLLKMDFLGLSNLTILSARRATLCIETRGEEADDLLPIEPFQDLPDGDDQDDGDAGAQGETFGVFQLESAGMRRYVQDLRSRTEHQADLCGPRCVVPARSDAAHSALHPRGQARTRSRSSYPHDDLAEILDETYGVIVYQDQVHAHRPEVRRLHAGPGGHHAEGDGQEEERDHGCRTRRPSCLRCH